MKLYIKPKYNYYLDCTYKGRKGKRSGTIHSGLSNPMRYGLTREQVQYLIKNNQWVGFINQWTQLRRRFLFRKGLACYVCGNPARKYISLLRQKICTRCQHRIERIVNE